MYVLASDGPVAELADAGDLKSLVLRDVRVRIPPGPVIIAGFQLPIPNQPNGSPIGCVRGCLPKRARPGGLTAQSGMIGPGRTRPNLLFARLLGMSGTGLADKRVERFARVRSDYNDNIIQVAERL